MKRPNIALIVLDSARADRFGCYGYARPTTPRIDALAEEGLLCEAMITQGPWTIPSHGSLFTGLYPSEHAAQWQTGMRLGPTVETTLAELLRGVGYSTLCVSENPLITEATGLTRGFDRVVIRSAAEGTLRRALRKARKAAALGGTGGDLVTEHALEALAGLRQPFFLFANYLECHWAYAGDPRFERELMRDPRSWLATVRARYREGLREGPWQGIARADEKRLRRLNDAYDACVRTADRLVSELLDGLGALGLLSDTLVLITADHGENIGDHGLADHHASLADTLIRVPFIAWSPARIAPRRAAGQYEFVDVLPTLAKLVEAPLPASLRERPYADFTSDPGKRHAFSEWRRWTEGELAGLRKRNPSYDFSAMPGNLLAVRTPRYKLVSDDRRGETLFDLEADPGETRDVAALKPEVAAQLRQALEEQRAAWEGAPAFDRIGAYSDADSAEIERRLADLGYI